MEMNFILILIGAVAVACAAYFFGRSLAAGTTPDADLAAFNGRIAALNATLEQLKSALEQQKAEAKRLQEALDQKTQDVTRLTADRDVQHALAQNGAAALDAARAEHAARIAELKAAHAEQLETARADHAAQLAQIKENTEKQIETLRMMNQEQVESQLRLIKEQMQTTSEQVLRRRQEELGERNREQVSRIIDPLQQSLKDMKEAFDKTKEQQTESLARLDETIRINMEKSTELGATADRLTRALTGEVKVQGNFGELKLKQLLEDMELREGEQFDTQETLRDRAGRSAKGDDGKGLVPDFILHFPNNRHVVVDSKMSLTDYERYMNTPDGAPEKTDYLKAHIASVRAQVKRLARKDYTRFLPDGYNRLNFAIMYVPIEGALNLALLNDATLWREAYDEGVLVLGPQTMYMNLRVLEVMWTQVRQLHNQQAMIDAANAVIDRVQDFGLRFAEVEDNMHKAVTSMSKLKITTADDGRSIITAARKLLKAGATENKKKKSLADLDASQPLLPESTFIEDEPTPEP